MTSARAPLCLVSLAERSARRVAAAVVVAVVDVDVDVGRCYLEQ